MFIGSASSGPLGSALSRRRGKCHQMFHHRHTLPPLLLFLVNLVGPRGLGVTSVRSQRAIGWWPPEEKDRDLEPALPSRRRLVATPAAAAAATATASAATAANDERAKRRKSRTRAGRPKERMGSAQPDSAMATTRAERKSRHGGTLSQTDGRSDGLNE